MNSEETTDTVARYKIAEPKPKWRGLAVHPLWPAAATCLLGVVPGMIWFAYNASVIGDVTNWDREHQEGYWKSAHGSTSQEKITFRRTR